MLHWHYWKAGLLPSGERSSPRFIWMANKETDRLTSYPTTLIKSAGTQTKLALRIARRYGCVPESTLPMNGKLSSLSTAARLERRRLRLRLRRLRRQRRHGGIRCGTVVVQDRYQRVVQPFEWVHPRRPARLLSRLDASDTLKLLAVALAWLAQEPRTVAP